MEKIIQSEFDHRIIGKKLDLFHFQEESPGNVFWHKNGFRILENIKNYIREELEKHNYQEVLTPCLIKKSLWEKSGHWDQFSENMFHINDNNNIILVKPMNCPCHIQIYNQEIHSYKELPIRISEFGYCHRNEPSGSMHGLLRGMSFTQDDAHIFCTQEQIEEEVIGCIDLLKKIYKTFGFVDIEVKYSLRPDNRIGDEDLWDFSENKLLNILKKLNINYEIQPKEGAFYGPKLEFILNDSMGRKWQCGTIQLDFFLPLRLEAQYINSNGAQCTPVLIHRAFLGSIERFLGILIENSRGNLPFWLQPIQCKVLSLTFKESDYAINISNILNEKGIFSVVDNRNEKINLKIRESILKKIPYIIICGKKEIKDNMVTVRDINGEQITLSIETLAEKLYKLKYNRVNELPDIKTFKENN